MTRPAASVAESPKANVFVKTLGVMTMRERANSKRRVANPPAETDTLANVVELNPGIVAVTMYVPVNSPLNPNAPLAALSVLTVADSATMAPLMGWPVYKSCTTPTIAPAEVVDTSAKLRVWSALNKPNALARSECSNAEAVSV